MIAALLPLFVAVPLLTGGALVITGGRPRVNQGMLLTILALATAGALALVWHLRSGEVLAHGVGLWPFGIAIPFAADVFSALMLTVTGILSLTCSAFAVLAGHGSRQFFAPMVLILTAGVNGALLTADLFNMFVFIEVMLLPSYALFVLAAPGRARLRQVAGARLYVTVNLLTSTIFLAGVALLYGHTGTVNLAELAGVAAESPPAAIATTVCLFALSIKASVVPVHGWLARAYPATSPAVTALFSGLHTKVAIYGIYRIYAVVFDGDSRFLWVGVVAFSLTMAIGVLGAVGENTTRSILAFHMVSQIGYILLGVALFGELGLAAGIFYMIHNIIVKASLFLTVGAVETRYGSDDIRSVTGLARTETLTAIAFVLAALSLAGLPPFSGFMAKFAIVAAALDEQRFVVAVIAVVVSLLTLASMMKMWNGMFWFSEHDDPDEKNEPVRVTPRIGPALAAPGLSLALISVGLGLGAQLLMSLSRTAAAGLVDTGPYVQAVMG